MLLKDINKEYGIKSVKNFQRIHFSKVSGIMYMKKLIQTLKWH